MKTAIVLLAEGFEEMEALAPVDIMRRAGIEVTTVGVTGAVVKGAHGIAVQADVEAPGFTLPPQAGLLLLPGGQPGTDNLGKSPLVAELLDEAERRGLTIAAVCAAPTVLHAAGLLKGRRATAFPAVQGQLVDAQVTGRAVEVDGNIITGRSAGVILAFSHALVAAVAGAAKADEVLAALYPGD